MYRSAWHIPSFLASVFTGWIYTAVYRGRSVEMCPLSSLNGMWSEWASKGTPKSTAKGCVSSMCASRGRGMLGGRREKKKWFSGSAGFFAMQHVSNTCFHVHYFCTVSEQNDYFTNIFLQDSNGPLNFKTLFYSCLNKLKGKSDK